MRDNLDATWVRLPGKLTAKVDHRLVDGALGVQMAIIASGAVADDWKLVQTHGNPTRSSKPTD